MGQGHEAGSGGRQTLIEAGTAFRGSFSSDCPIVVKGRIEGEISGPSLTVSATGSVSGTVKVQELRSEGELSGEYDAELVELSGTVKDNTVIRAKSLEIRLTPERGRMQVVFGECELAVGDVPTEKAAVSEAEAAAAALDAPPASISAPPPAAAEATAFDGGAPAASDSSAEASSEAEAESGEGETPRKRGRSRHNTLPPGV